MKTLEISLDDNLHRKLRRASKATSQSIDRLIQNLLAQSLKQTQSRKSYSEALLAEGYQVMAKENAVTVNDILAAQIMAIENQEGNNNDFKKIGCIASNRNA